MTTPARRRRAGHVLAALTRVSVVAVVLMSCSGSGYEYIKDSTSTAFFKIPSAWSVYDENQILDNSSIQASPQAKQAFAQATWMVAFDGDSPASPDNLFIFGNAAQKPTGFAQVRPLGQSERDTFSLSTIRNALFDVDGTTSNTPAEILSTADVVLPGGFHGLHVEYNVPQGQDFLTVNQIGVVDPATSTLYLFAIGCEAHCYLDNQSVIDQIAGSWTVKEPT
jgi:hypothetical protein